MTVLFCDVVGSTELASHMDAEDWHSIVAEYQRTVTTIVSQFGGYIGHYVGDGLMVWFGYPEAHEDDPERAVGAGLAMIEAVAALGTNSLTATAKLLPPGTLRVRVGVNTGPLVVGKGGGGRLDVFGDVPNVASRVESVAEPNAVLITSDTHRLVDGLFVVDAPTQQRLKGVAEPIDLYRVRRPSGVRGRLHVARSPGLTPFVGREVELRQLRQSWERACAGDGQVVLITGEPGIGKSRLVLQVKHEIAATPHSWIEWTCSPRDQQVPFSPAIELVRQSLGWKRDGAPDGALAQLEEALESGTGQLREAAPLVARLLGLAVAGDHPALSLSPEQQRRRTLDALLALLLVAARQQPLVLALEDVQWADPSTLDLQALLVEHGARARLLILYTARPEFSPAWPPAPHHTHIEPGHLSREETRQMVTLVAGRAALSAPLVPEGAPLSGETIATVVARTDGIPLFVEELTKVVIEPHALDSGKQRIPMTLRDSLMARLDRLGPAREVAQIASVVGRHFSLALLEAIATVPRAQLRDGLSKLAEAELIFDESEPPDATYVFKHALIEETAYDSLLKSRRRELHRSLARALVERFPHTVAEQPALLAHHYTAAEMLDEAVPQWSRAGQRAIERAANQEAIGHLTRGLELLSGLPPSVEHSQHELSMLIPLGLAWMARKGYAAPQARAVFDRSLAICRSFGESPQLTPVLGGLFSFFLTRAEFRTAHEVAEQIMRLAENQNDRMALVGAHLRLGVLLVYEGQLRAARAHLDQVLALHEIEGTLAAVYSEDPASGSRAFLGLALWMLGFPAQALAASTEALAMARAAKHQLGLAQAQAIGASLHAFRRDWQSLRAISNEMITHATEHDLPLFAFLGAALQGVAGTQLGALEPAIEQVRGGLDSYCAIGALAGAPLIMVLLARAYLQAGRASDGLRVIDEALQLASQGEHAVDAELYRVRGEILLRRQGEPPDAQALSAAEESLLHAEDIARRQEARSWELRVAMSLARLWSLRGETKRARRHLGEIHAWFTEGFDTPDLQDAKRLLAELA